MAILDFDHSRSHLFPTQPDLELHFRRRTLNVRFRDKLGMFERFVDLTREVEV
jgi:hypothetical protein